MLAEDLNNCTSISSSFRDPDGHLFFRDGILYRAINESYFPHYEKLMSSGLYESLTSNELLIPHTEISTQGQSYRLIRPELIPFISYPHEWSFSQLKDSALLTLEIEERALKAGMTLKDASAFNIQFRGTKPIFIDTLSFEEYREGEPWQAYRQFCQHFLAPLALMAKKDVRLSKLSHEFIDGIPLDLASKLLGGWALNFGLMLHLHLHARSQNKYAEKGGVEKKTAHKISKQARLGIIDSLKSTISALKWSPGGTEWAEYYESNNNYTDDSFAAKRGLVERFLSSIEPKSVWDLGANEGVFSTIAANTGAYTLSVDYDPSAVEKNYLRLRKEKNKNILPLVLDLTNPTAGYGWAGSEREAFFGRSSADAILALALVHHLAISNNVPLSEIACFFASSCKYLVIEFVPKSDSQVKKLLSSRRDIFPNYTKAGFEAAFKRSFNILKEERVGNSERHLYLMQKIG